MEVTETRIGKACFLGECRVHRQPGRDAEGQGGKRGESCTLVSAQWLGLRGHAGWAKARARLFPR